MSCSKEIEAKSVSQRSSSEVQHLVPNAQHLVPNAQHLVPNAQHLVPNAQHLVPNAHHLLLYRIIPFNIRHGNCGGSLVQFQAGDAEVNALPFSIGKVLVMSDIRTDDVRGLHAHYETEEILVALTGGCTVDVDDGKGQKETVSLSAYGGMGVRECGSKGVEGGNTETPKRTYSDTQEALLLYPHVWRVMRDFEPGTTLMVIANIKYDEADYIRDRAEFERVCRGWKTLGGTDSSTTKAIIDTSGSR